MNHATMRKIGIACIFVTLLTGTAHTETRLDAKDINQFTASMNDLEASVKVTQIDPKELEKIGSDFALNYRLKNMTLLYKSPDKLRIEGHSNLFGNALLIQNGVSRFYAIPKLRLRKTEDLKDSPLKRLSLLEYAGLLGKDTLSYMQGKFVKEDKLDGKTVAVYELTYQSENGGKSRYRLSIDPKTRITLKRIWFDAANKVKATFLYSDPQETSSGVFMPRKCEILNAEGISAATMIYSAVKLDQGLEDALFSVTPPQ